MSNKVIKPNKKQFTIYINNKVSNQVDDNINNQIWDLVFRWTDSIDWRRVGECRDQVQFYIEDYVR